MANEADILTSSNLEYRQVTVADGTAIAKGALIVLGSDPNTGVIATGANTDIPLGFLAVEKAANDGQTTVPVLVRGDVDAVADGAITLGHLVVPGSVTANRVEQASAVSLSQQVVMRSVLGRCLETASDAEKVRIRLMLG